MAACPRLTELTIIFPHGYWTQRGEIGFLLDQAGRARLEILELVSACKALPDFDTLQIVHYPVVPYTLTCWCKREGCDSHWPALDRWELALGQQTRDLQAWAMDCLKEPKTGLREGEGRKKIALKVIGFGPGCRSMGVEKYEV